MQYCGEPPRPRGSVLGLRPPGLEFRILCLVGSVISSSHYPQEALLAKIRLYVHKGGPKPHSFHSFNSINQPVIAGLVILGKSTFLTGP